MHRTRLNEALELIQNMLGHAHLPYRVIETEWVQMDRALRVYIDSLDPLQGVNMDDCAAVSKLVSDIIELDSLVSGDYNLEVSSPGIERPVRLKDDFLAHVGKTLKVRVSKIIDGKRQETGELLLLGDGGFAVKTLSGFWPFSVDSVHSARLVYDWTREDV
ncbi:MAG: hypothetical protein WCI18_07445 [Pseudomonadota bacterium]